MSLSDDLIQVKLDLTGLSVKVHNLAARAEADEERMEQNPKARRAERGDVLWYAGFEWKVVERSSGMPAYLKVARQHDQSTAGIKIDEIVASQFSWTDGTEVL